MGDAIRVEPLTATIGAEVHEVDLAAVDDTTFDELHKAFLDHKVLFFRDQHLSVDEHIAFGRRWGELEVHPFAREGAAPEIVEIESTADQPYAASNWHSDVTWRECPSLGSILRARVVPPVGGDTLWADACAAYDRLSDDWKDRIEGLTASHDWLKVFGRRLSEEEREASREQHPVVHHPVVRTHPETGARGIYTNRSFVTHVDDVEPEESEAILERLERAIMDPNVQCRFRWRVDSIAFWDNRCTQHFATNDFWPGHRRVERVTVAGDRPFA
ncbi:MAG: TauD/TfdA family dioxygenase [Actinomycetota bacterium]